MPDRRRHRGPHPVDRTLFHADHHARLRAAVRDLSWLLERRYAEPSALKLVGDRYQLTARQRLAVLRSACSDSSLARRRAHRVEPAGLRDEPLLLDGLNVLTTVEAALAGGVILLGRDGAARDMASMHGSYRRVEETRPALERIGRWLEETGIAAATWYLDRPVSNSGRLMAFILELAREKGWPWTTELVADPDPVLARATTIVATADSVILDRATRWTNLGRAVIETIDTAWIVDLG